MAEVLGSADDHGGRVSVVCASSYTVNVGGWSSLAMVDERYAVDGTEVTVERHTISEVRAVLST